MKLRHAGWLVLTGILLMVRPAFATAPSDSSQPPIEPPRPKTAISTAELPASSPAGGAVVPTAVSPGDIFEEGNGSTQPPVAGNDEAAEPAAPVMPAAALMPLPERNFMKPEVTLKAVIDLSSQRMTVMTGDDRVLHQWPISSGRRGYHTPNGIYYPQWRSRMWRSRQYDGAPMPYPVFFHRGYAVHGTYATGLLGRPASHGCIRLSTKNAATFYKLVEEHGMQSTQIIVKGQTRSAPARVARGRSSTPRRRIVRQRVPRGYANYEYGTPSWWTW